ncbi:hypothetical protein [Paenibacillus sp. N3.4]|uniref:hypothetical protein n=1 Tax=Paenibacillus sp. N3.4 TaxID=2603222 RepID=UPI0011C952BB|nr:hypothetical protein [Paenibacillus sp. N3.4]TXK77740.1 hypothetical protein FU659_21925 [Paenibacillus sp. N3.4]
MPELGKYEKVPRPESIQFFLSRVGGHPKVTDVEQIDKQLFLVKKTNRRNLRVFLTNYYVVSEAEVYEIMSQHKDLNCIITISMWNSYSNSGKTAAANNGIALFKINEFMGALYVDGEKFINFITREERERREREAKRGH